MCRPSSRRKRAPPVATKSCRGRHSRKIWRPSWRRQRIELVLRRVSRLGAILLTGLLCFAVPQASAQESSSASRPETATPPASAPNAPSAALRDALFAACSQSEQNFSKFLTARNADTFAHLTPSARVALMKRFVLLNEPGKPSLVPSPSGRPIVHCQTPGGAAELQIGGAETADNLAFLPVEVRDATDTVGNSAVRVKMGLVRENGE